LNTKFDDVRESEIQTAEPLASEPSDVEFEIVLEKLESHDLRDIYQIPAELFKARGKIFFLRFENIFILFGIRWNCLMSGMSPSL
jgi:hypothetical protein